ncbi:hypothetical protein [Kaistella montana]|uniref:Lipocalin-like domain-containing protein n=1 Tax=Kaistella montana TaxID=1849733 RepID=A0ABW5K6Y5_9FLAO|nr:hypothetical protein [Kaistella montana]MCQ4034961.1 hypothetical protein [Kaistella montana]
MKRAAIFLTFFFFAISLISCEREDGKWDDNIKLSQKNVTVNSNANTIEITTQSTYWWLNEISFNGNNADLSSIDKFSKNFIYTTSDYKVERKEDGKKIIIIMNENSSNLNRSLIVGLQNGDYFDGIKVIQSK